MSIQPLLRPLACTLLIASLTGCASMWPWGSKNKEAEPAPQSSAPAKPADIPAATPAGPQAPASTAASISAADLEGLWECRFNVTMGQDRASYIYTNQFRADKTLKSQAHLDYELPSTKQRYSFVLQGVGHWRMEGNTITLIVPKVSKQDRSTQKHPELMRDKDLVPEDLSDTWQVQAHQGKNMRVIAGSLADEMLCQKE